MSHFSHFFSNIYNVALCWSNTLKLLLRDYLRKYQSVGVSLYLKEA